MKRVWAKLSIVTFALVVMIALGIVSGTVFAATVNITVNQSWYGCCNATVNDTVVETNTSTNVSVEIGVPFNISATFNSGDCDTFYFWGNESWWPHPNVSAPWSMNTTMNVTDNLSLSAFCDEWVLPTIPPMPTAAPANYSTAEYSTWETVGFPYQRQNFVIDYGDTGLHWAFYLNNSTESLCYRTSTDGFNWSDQTEIADYFSDWGDYPNFNGSSFSLWLDENSEPYTVHIAMVNWSSWIGSTLIYEKATPLLDGSLVSTNGWQTVSEEIGEQYLGPSVCTNSTGYPFIGISKTEFWADPPYTGFNVSLFHSAFSNGIWAEHSEFPKWNFANASGDGTADYEQWLSVIPVEDGNVSCQYAAMWTLDGGYHYMYQNYITNIADTWTVGNESLVSASYPVASWYWMGMYDWVGPYHSEVHFPTVYNDNDVFMAYTSEDEDEYWLIYDTANDLDSVWNNGYEDSLSNYSYTAALSIFNSDYDMVLTLNDWRGDELYTAPYEVDTETWGNISELFNESQAESYDDWIVAGYKYASPLGFMWVYSPDEGTYDIDYGWYGEGENWEEWWENPSSEEFPCWILWFILPLVVAILTLIFCIRTISENMTLQNAAMTMAIVVIVGFITFLIVKALLGDCS